MKKLMNLLSLTAIVLLLSAANEPNLTNCTVKVTGAPQGLEVILSIYNNMTNNYEEVQRKPINEVGEVVFTQLVIGQKYKFETAAYSGYTTASSEGHIMYYNYPWIPLTIFQIQNQ